MAAVTRHRPLTSSSSVIHRFRRLSALRRQPPQPQLPWPPVQPSFLQRAASHRLLLLPLPPLQPPQRPLSATTRHPAITNNPTTIIRCIPITTIRHLATIITRAGPQPISVQQQTVYIMRLYSQRHWMDTLAASTAQDLSTCFSNKTRINFSSK